MWARSGLTHKSKRRFQTAGGVIPRNETMLSRTQLWSACALLGARVAWGTCGLWRGFPFGRAVFSTETFVF